MMVCGEGALGNKDAVEYNPCLYLYKLRTRLLQGMAEGKDFIVDVRVGTVRGIWKGPEKEEEVAH